MFAELVAPSVSTLMMQSSIWAREKRLLWLLCSANMALFLASASWAAATYRLRDNLLHNRDNELLWLMDWYCKPAKSIYIQRFLVANVGCVPSSNTQGGGNAAPVRDQTQIDLIETRVNGSLIDLDHSLFRAPPSAEVGAAWASSHSISTEAVIRLSGQGPVDDGALHGRLGGSATRHTWRN
ncbi:hypothetical protein JDV02_009181 [Purpureocillium takamizusanense]|uniref:Uncharacterized protein n=1 Tax=Purpureocillium takamizusanense TaxID=2060973 RepID=A0A9Q8QR57_9HYPO|nr:uncharacterized protein JDV02_009181 [Purpureocillium takamizusanense]UNI23356.1 hypothetical protein JDV02_009181 [Purpureocillium takamizusanense]